MRSFLVVSLFTLSAGEQFSLQSASTLLRDHVSQLVLNGGTRGAGLATVQKNMVDRLLSQTGSELDEAGKKLLGNVSDLLDGLLTSLASDRDTKQGLLDTAKGAFQAFVDSSTFRANYDSSKTHYTELHQNHSICRHEQVTLLTDTTTDCDAFDSWMESTQNSIKGNDICVNNYGDSTADMDTIVGLLFALKGQFETAKGTTGPPATFYVEKYLDCAQATSTSDSKDTTCDGKQTSFESDHCTQTSNVVAMCGQEDTEYGAKETQFNNLKAAIQPLSSQRVTDANMVSYLKCLVDELKVAAAATLEALEANCANVKDASYVSYANTFDDFPDQNTCPPSAGPWETNTAPYSRITMNSHLESGEFSEADILAVGLVSDASVVCA